MTSVVARIGLALALGAIFATPSATAAQVNAEVLRPDPYRPGWGAGLDAAFALLRGNVDLLDVGGAARAQYQTLHAPPLDTAGKPVRGAVPWIEHRAFVTVSGRWSEVNGRLFASRGFAHARWTAMWHPNLGSDVFVQGQFDELQRLRARVIGGLGLRAELVHERSFTLAMGTAPMLEYDLVDPAPGAADPPETLDVRWTSYLTARVALFEDQLLAQATGYVQPRFDDFADVRVLVELEVLARITPTLAFGTTLTVLHDSRPPTAVQGTDVRLATTLRVTL